MREHITLLRVIEGEKYLRVHGGVVYFYHEDKCSALFMCICFRYAWILLT